MQKVTPVASLILPQSIKKDVNPLSGYLNWGSKYYKKTPKGLFLSPENIEYLQNETVAMVTFPTFVDNIFASAELEGATTKNLIDQLNKNREKVRDLVKCRAFSHKIPYQEETLQRGEVMLLNEYNKNFILELSKSIILAPNMIIPDFYERDPLTGKLDDPQWDYGASSYSDGTWHPEHLFTNNPRNKREPYWVPGEVSFDTNPQTPPFDPREMRRIRSTYAEEFSEEPKSANPGPGPGNKYMYASYAKGGFKTSGGQFPRWQYPAQGIKLIKRNFDEGLQGGGREDRRVTFNRKYDMSHLIKKPTY